MDLTGIGGILLGLVIAWAAFIALLWVFRPRDVRLGELLRIVPDVLRLVRGILGDRSAPIGVRLALIGLLGWLVSPIDLIPEFIPVLGPLDDVVVAVLVLRYVRRRIGEREFRERWPGSDEGYALLARVL
ncbi:MAG: DUF1232 domain-containing protein [Candidatus Limnocylindria bacterium]